VGDMLRKDDSLRCPKTEKCLEKVLTGSTAYVTCKRMSTIKKYSNRAILFYRFLVKVATYQIIEDEMSKYGKCSFSVAANQFLMQLKGFAFPKDSQIGRAFNTG